MPGAELTFDNGRVADDVDADTYQLTVYVGGGERYHESETCPRGDAVPTFWGFAVDAGLDPCGKCATSFEGER